MEVSYTSRPYKIAKNDGKFKGIVAANLKELKQKAIQSLEILGYSADDVCVFLAEDDTLIDDQEYFATIPKNTKLMIHIEDKRNTRDSGKVYLDAPDGSVKGKPEISESQEVEHIYTSLEPPTSSIPNAIRDKITGDSPVYCIVSILRMSDEELKFLSDCSLETLQKELKIDEDVARACVDGSEKELLRRQELSNATQLLTMFEKAKNTDQVDGGKRKKPCS